MKNIDTEKRNPKTTNIDNLPTDKMLELINKEDQTVPLAIADIIPIIAESVDRITSSMNKGGRLLYVGAGTSGRLGVLDAVECPPTFNAEPSNVLGVIAGGEKAIFQAAEGAEDDIEAGRKDIQNLNVNKNDTVVGIAASGRTPYTIGALEAANENSAYTIALVCSYGSPLAETAETALEVNTGPEAITGSTRMKAGTAQKLILNMLSTGTMIRQGKVYGNLMVDLQPSNIKLRERALSIIIEATGCSESEAIDALENYKEVKPAIVSLLTSLQGNEVANALLRHRGRIQDILNGYPSADTLNKS